MTRPIYRGWWALLLGALAMVGTLPGRTQGLGLVTAPMLADLHLGEGAFARMNLIATLVGAGFALPGGWLIDRVGVRLAVPLFELGLGAAVLAMARAHDAGLLLLLLVLTRGFGQTALSIGSLATVGKWFSRRLEKAMGIYALVLGMGFIAAFPGVQKAAEVRGWRVAWEGVGWALLTAALLSALCLRSGAPADEPEMQPRTQTVERGRSLTLIEALRTPAFWVYGGTSALYLVIASGTSLWTELMLRERGLPASVFRAALATTALVGILANFGGGFLAARGSLPRLLGLASLLLLPCLLAFPHLTTQAHAIAWAAGLGAAGGVVTVVFFAIWGKAYGPAHLGQTQGVAQALTVLGSALGPVLFAWSKEATGRFDTAFYALAPAVLIAGVACLLVRPPDRAA
jgi:MFS family permease